MEIFGIIIVILSFAALIIGSILLYEDHMIGMLLIASFVVCCMLGVALICGDPTAAEYCSDCGQRIR